MVRMQGDHAKDPGRPWALPLGISFAATGFYLPIIWLCGGNCALPGVINPILEPWRQKGLQAMYMGGSKHFQARIRVTTPGAVPGTTVVGQPLPATQVGVLPATQVAVLVPEGSGAGTVMQFTAPDGRLMQATVPQGVAPGQTFLVPV